MECKNKGLIVLIQMDFWKDEAIFSPKSTAPIFQTLSNIIYQLKPKTYHPKLTT